LLELSPEVSPALVGLSHTFIDELPLPLGIATDRRPKRVKEESKRVIIRFSSISLGFLL
jgi:hypothetical protein